MRPIRRLAVLCVMASIASTAASVGGPSSADVVRDARPEDRYAMAGGCYTVRSLDADAFLVRTADGFALGGEAAAEPFHFQATDLGRYLLFGTRSDFLAMSDALVGVTASAASATPAGGIVDGLTAGISGRALDAVSSGPVGAATGRGARIVAAPEPSELADWEIEQAAADAFTISLPATGQTLPGTYGFELADGCATYPEVEIDIDGPVATGETPFGEVRGFLDDHVHMMAFEFVGGRARCGRPWHPYGVAHALVDCPDHYPNGAGAVLEQVLSGAGTHDVHGWPSFLGWPRYNSHTHEQLYYKWLERAWRGGLRLFTNLLVDNNVLCEVYPYRHNSCNEMDGVRLQAQRLRELERYIDAQSGGPGEGWFRIVTDPFEARRVINAGKLAVIMGIEVSVPLDCGLIVEVARCDPAKIDKELDEVYALGVRQMELANKFDNALTGVTGDGGTTGLIVNGGNVLETGRFWQMQTCPDDAHGHDEPQYDVHDTAGTPDSLTGRDSIFAGILQVAGTSGAAPAYPPGPHCNVRGLTELGRHAVEGLMARHMIFDPDHMAAKARHQALDVVEAAGYSGVVSSHSWSDDTIYPRVWHLGGVVTPYAGGSRGMVSNWKRNKAWADPRFLFGFGYGSDVNGFGAQGGPRGAEAPDKVSYPFTGFGGVTVHQQRSGERVYDINTDGVAHYGMYPDWIEDLHRLAGDAIVEDMTRGPEAYLQMWERAVGVSPNACRADVADLSDADVARVDVGISADDVVRTLGQPASREGTRFRYCMAEGRTATVTFSHVGAVEHVDVA
jgi:hypothetical protein